MKYLFSPEGLKALDRLEPKHLLLAFDFDGTLAPVVALADQAQMPEESAALLKKLSRRAHVALISGRGVRDLRSKLSFRPRWAIGNHGLEAPWMNPAQAAKVVRGWVKKLEKAWPFTEDTGVYIENKKYSVSLHYRLAKDPRGARRELLRLIGGLDPLPRVVPGKCVLNLTLEDSPHKGEALIELMRRTHCTHALFAGDDDTDEDVFRLNKRGLLTVRVGKKASSKAKFYVRNQAEVALLLKSLLDRL